MGWFDESDENAPAAEHALKVAAKKSLPITARSRTHKEYLAFHRRHGLLLGAIYALLMGGLMLGLALDSGQQSRMILQWVAPFVFLCGLALYLLFRWRLRRLAVYRDPALAVDVGADGIIVRGAGGDYGMRWSEVDTTLNWVRVKHGVHFQGVWVQSPLGLIDLKEENYVQGHAAAALIVRGKHDDYHARQKAKIERIG